MPTITKTWAFTSNSQSWAFTPVGTGNAGAWQSSGGDPGGDAGCINNVTTGKNRTGTGHWDLTGTWESLFGVPAGATVTQVGGAAGDKHWWKCSVYTTGAASTEGPFELRNSGGTVVGTFTGGNAYSGTTAGASPAAAAVSVPAGSQPSNSTISLRLNGSVNTGNSVSANNTLLQDTVVLTVTYTLPAINCQLAATESPDVCSVQSSVKVSSQLSAAESSDVMTIQSAVQVSSSLSVTEPADVMTAAVTVGGAINLQLQATESPDTLSSSVKVPIGVQVSSTEITDTISAQIGARDNLSVVSTDHPDSLSLAASLSIRTVLAATEPPDVCYLQSGVKGQVTVGAVETPDLLSVTVLSGSQPSGPPARNQSRGFGWHHY